jgi:hypothetical protein
MCCRQGLVHENKHQSAWEIYEIVKEIGHGMTGKVYQVKHKATNEIYALKCKLYATRRPLLFRLNAVHPMTVSFSNSSTRVCTCRHGNASD